MSGRRLGARRDGELRNNLALSAAFALCLAASAATPDAAAQAWSSGMATHVPETSTPVYTPPPLVQAPQPPVIQITPPIRIIPTIPIRPDVPRNFPTPVNPRDLVGTSVSLPGENIPSDNALKGLSPMQEQQFPSGEHMSGSSDWILVRSKPDSEFTKTNSYSVHLDSGQLLVSVRRPSRMALLTCDQVEVSAGADSDVLFTRENGTVRIANLTGLKDAVKVRLKSPFEGGTGTTVFSVKPGYEFILREDRQLNSRDIRVADGVARRHFSYVENGHAAIAEISVESVLKDCDLIANLDQQSTNAKEKRILSDMSKMAAVLNYVNGEIGYKSEGQVTLEVNSRLNQSAKTN